jgi:chorismate synthase
MLRFETAGESHGECLVATLAGLPAGVPIALDRVNRELWRRQQGYGRGGRQRIEKDCARIVSGVRHGHTIGSPGRTGPRLSPSALATTKRKNR